MKTKKYSLLVFFYLIIFISCNDSLEFTVEDYQQKLVVEGWIEQGQYPQVLLTRSAAYFDKIDSTSIRDLIVTTAKITVSDGEREEILTLKLNEDYFPPYIYQGTEIRGEEGKSYDLKIETGGKIYQASTYLPKRPEVDSLWFSLAEGKDSLGIINGRFQDDPDQDNFYRTFTRLIGIDRKYVPVYLSATGDRFFNGKQFTFSLLRGSESINEVTEDVYYKKGDTVRVKVCSIDQAHFDFWRTIEREIYTVGNPFSSTGNEVISNVSGGAIGVWGGYGASYYQLILK